MITIDNSVPEAEKCILFGPDGRIGEIENIYGFYRARLSIKREKADGYYIEYNEMRYSILPDGRLSRWPEEFGNFVDTYLNAIFDD